MVTIRQYADSARAELDKSVLAAKGIHAFLADENSVAAGFGGVLGGVRLQVAEANAERARQVLKQQENVTPLPDDFVPPKDRSVMEPKSAAKSMSDTKNVIAAVVISSLVVLLAVSLFRYPRTADTTYIERAQQAYDERARRSEALITTQEQTHERYVEFLNKAEQDQRRFEKILATWEQQQAQYQKYLDGLGKKP